MTPKLKGTIVNKRAVGAVAAAVAVGVGISGCGSVEIDAAKAQKFVRAELNSPARSVGCPSGVTPKKGGTYTCHITYADGDRAVVRLRERDAKGTLESDNSELRVLTIGALHAENVIRSLAGQHAHEIQRISCANDVRVTPGATVPCQLSYGGGLRLLVDAHVSGTQGDLVVSASDIHVGK